MLRTIASMLLCAAALAACGGSSNPGGCHSASDCPAGDVCLAGTCANNRADGGAAVCTPPSTPATWHLVNGGTIGPATGPTGCGRPLGSSSLPAGQVQKLGTQKVGTPLSFTVPAGTGTISVVQQLVGSTVDSITAGKSTVANTVVPLDLHTSAGDLVYDDTVATPSDPSTAQAWYTGSSPSTGAFTIPNTTAALTGNSAGYPAGTWHLTVGDYAYECAPGNHAGCSGGNNTTTYDVTVVTKPLQPTTGTVDIAFYLVSSSAALTATKALTDTGVARFLKTLASIYAEAGLCLGTITFYDAPDWAKTRFATGVSADTTGPCSELDQMFTLALPGNRLNFFFVDSITQGSGGGIGQVVGLDGTIPGPSTVGGTIHSGAVVNASDIGAGQQLSGACNGATDFTRCGPDQTAYITAHEGGHWMGLYHTTEGIGTYYDTVADTPICDCKSCAGSTASNCYDPNATNNPSNPTQLTGAMCTQTASKANCGGGDNLMFWLLDEKAAGAISNQQGQIIRANPVVQ